MGKGVKLLSLRHFFGSVVMLGELPMISPLVWVLQGAQGNQALEMLIFFGNTVENSSWVYSKQIHPLGKIFQRGFAAPFPSQ